VEREFTLDVVPARGADRRDPSQLDDGLRVPAGVDPAEELGVVDLVSRGEAVDRHLEPRHGRHAGRRHRAVGHLGLDGPLDPGGAEGDRAGVGAGHEDDGGAVGHDAE
jgi:hypothetical protein